MWVAGQLRSSSNTRNSRREDGFAALTLLILVAVFGAISASIVASGSILSKRQSEEELLYIGGQFQKAIRSYYEAGVGGGRYPISLAELVRDTRIPGIHRYLRKVYRDPLTGSIDWGVVVSPQGGIMGVYSKALGTPIKQDGFPSEFAAFKGAGAYKDWVFNFVPEAKVPIVVRGSIGRVQQ